MRRAVFFDRDGTLTRERGYVTRVADLELLPGAAAAVRRVNLAGLQAVLVTNQSAVARGLVDEAGLAEIHDCLREALAKSEARLDGIYHCPHHPDLAHPRLGRRCDCRKPAPGLLRRAVEEMGIDASNSFMIGDRWSDLEAAASAGVTPLLVLTGAGRYEFEYHAQLSGLNPAHVAPDVEQAVSWVLERGVPR